MNIISLIYKSFRRIAAIINGRGNRLYTKFLLISNNVAYKSFHTNGIPYVMVA